MKNWFTPLAATGRLRRAPARIVVVIAGPNPSFDYYLAPRLERCGMPVQIADLGAAPSGRDARDELSGAFVLFCRYASGAWMQAVEECADAIAGVGLFIDDDMDALFADSSVPLSYRLRVMRRHLVHRRRLAQACDVLLVSNDALASRNAGARPKLISPMAGAEDLPAPPAGDDRVRVAFHSTSVHAAEHRWLRAVMRSVLPVNRQMSFEVIARPPQAWLWRGVSGAEIVRPMPWPEYRTASRTQHADLLLAPLVPSVANAARSWTKRIDAMRLGAALLVSDADVYQAGSEERSLGMCVPPAKQAWADAIHDLAADRVRLARLRDLNRAYVMSASASDSRLLDSDLLPE